MKHGFDTKVKVVAGVFKGAEGIVRQVDLVKGIYTIEFGPPYEKLSKMSWFDFEVVAI